MTSKSLATVTTELIASYGNTAKNVINAYRMGNARAVSYMDHRWTTAVKKAGTRLSPEVRTNALSAQKKVSGYYSQGIALTSNTADMAVQKAVNLAGKGVAQVAANASRFEQSTGVTALNTLAVAAIPAATAVTKVAAKIEVQSLTLVNKIAGFKANAKAKTKATRAAVKRTPRKTSSAVSQTA
jgi:hypothetical protein